MTYPKDIPPGYLGRLDRNANDLVAPPGQVMIVAVTRAATALNERVRTRDLPALPPAPADGTGDSTSSHPSPQAAAPGAQPCRGSLLPAPLGSYGA